MTKVNPFNAISSLKTSLGMVKLHSLNRLEKALKVDISRLPFSIKGLIENVLRHCDGHLVTEGDVSAISHWNAKKSEGSEIPFLPARVVLQDFTGVPCVADLAAMRSAVHKMGGDTKRINPIVPGDPEIQ